MAHGVVVLEPADVVLRVVAELVGINAEPVLTGEDDELVQAQETRRADLEVAGHRIRSNRL